VGPTKIIPAKIAINIKTAIKTKILGFIIFD
jgi:hypothetical protein